MTDTEKWARSSFALAKVSAYGPLTENASKPPKPTKAYLIKMEGIGQKQAALAGYRLADRMIQLFRRSPLQAGLPGKNAGPTGRPYYWLHFRRQNSWASEANSSDT